MKPILDYWLSKLFYDLHTSAGIAAEFREHRDDVLARYPLTDPVRSALRDNNVAFLASRTNPFLLRYYFFVVGMTDRDFIDGLQPLKSQAPIEAPDG
jgi:hypothetical protein